MMIRKVVRAASPEMLAADVSPLSYRELEDVYLQTQTRIWLGEVLHIRFEEETDIANLLADGELLFQVSKVVWKMLLKKEVDLKHSKIHIYDKTSSGKSDGRYMPYPKVDSFLKICKILGLTGIDLFSPSDVVEKRDVRRVCLCIRSLSKKSRLRNLDIPDFDTVTYTVAMPTDLVGGIRKSLEQSQCSSTSSCMDSREMFRQQSIREDNDSLSESDEAESAFVDPEFESPFSNVSYDVINMSCIVSERPVSETNFQVDILDRKEDGCNISSTALVDSCHLEAAKNGNDMLKELDCNKRSCAEHHNNQAVNNRVDDTGFMMWPISNLGNQTLINDCLQSGSSSSEGFPYKLHQQLVNAGDTDTLTLNKLLKSSSPQLESSDSYKTPEYANEELMKTQIVCPGSFQEVSCTTIDNDSVTSECSVNGKCNLSKNLNLDKMERNEDIALLRSENNSSNADTNATDWSSDSETESNFLCDLSLLQSIFDSQEMQLCVKPEDLESIGSFSSIANEKQISAGDHLHLDRDDTYMLKTDLDTMNNPFDIETSNNKGKSPSGSEVAGVCDQNEGECTSSVNIYPSGIIRSLPCAVMPVNNVSVSGLEVDVDNLLNEAILATDCQDVPSIDLTSDNVLVGEKSIHFNTVDVESQLVSGDGDMEFDREMKGTGAEQHCPCVTNTNLMEVKELCEEQYAPSGLEKNSTNITPRENSCSSLNENYVEDDGGSISLLVEDLRAFLIEECNESGESDSRTPEKTALRSLQEMVSYDLFPNKDNSSFWRMKDIPMDVSDDTNTPMQIDGAERKSSSTLMIEHLSKTTHLDDMKHKESEQIVEEEKAINVDEEFEMHLPVALRESDKKKKASDHPRGKKVLKSIFGGITLAGALFFALHLKGKRDRERTRVPVPLQTPKSRSEQPEKGNTGRLYPADKLKF